MNCMNCDKPVPSTFDLCDACFEQTQQKDQCPVCGQYARDGACFNHECPRNDFALRGMVTHAPDTR